MKLKEYFDSTGVSQRFFANKADISKASLNDYVHDRKIPPIRTALKIEKASGGLVTLYDWVDALEEDHAQDVKGDKAKGSKKRPS